MKNNEEIQLLYSELANMFEVALHFAGVKKEFMKKAEELYFQKFDIVFKDEDEINSQDIIFIINCIKKDNPEIFEKLK